MLSAKTCGGCNGTGLVASGFCHGCKGKGFYEVVALAGKQSSKDLQLLKSVEKFTTPEQLAAILNDYFTPSN
ncbi:hypothetical protein [Cytobacillus oceanisediminis]|uniref:hypothetical protein n=1 Tax=Cytobacillus oceanisediminis TaxID=665099 RepID=UPI001FB36AFC|nr:hypothetical protein [Cytobacillus oceanisediminis]UOE58179.1 hypothetical protein IRB79_27115 [Cytobacillus oceanisediminis]